jgi:hypothetical protein
MNFFCQCAHYKTIEEPSLNTTTKSKSWSIWRTHKNHKRPASQVQAWAKLGKKLSPYMAFQKTLMLTQAKLRELDITKPTT